MSATAEEETVEAAWMVEALHLQMRSWETERKQEVRRIEMKTAAQAVAVVAVAELAPW